MAVEVKLPRLGQGMEAGTIVRWLKSEGDQVAKGEPLYELDTDKVTQEVEAEADGVLLKIVVPDGEVDVGTTVGVIGAEGEEVAVEAPSKPSDEGEQPAAASEGQVTEKEAAAAEAPSVDVTQGNGGARRSCDCARFRTRRAGPARARRAREGVAARASHRARARHRPGHAERNRARGPRHRRGRREGRGSACEGAALLPPLPRERSRSCSSPRSARRSRAG